jgi:predicted RNA binding protein YcfA (HicA-like mRNA interferase family)
MGQVYTETNGQRRYRRRVKSDKILEKVLRGVSDANIEFDDLRHLLNGLGFQERIRGSHHIYTKDGVVEIINLPPNGSKAKPYQVKQARMLILKYKLAGENDQV